MITLKIKEPGYTINLPGIHNIKTPVEINVSKLSADLVISTLRKIGVSKFEIINSEKRKIPLPKSSEVKQEPESKTVPPIIERIYVPDDGAEVKSRLDKIEILLSKFVNDNTNTNKHQEVKIKKEKESEEKINYVPPVDISGFKSRGAISHKTTKGTYNNTEEAASLLKSITNKTKK
jgi:hypothetical protein